MFLLARVSLHHHLVKYSNIRGQIADPTRQTYGHVWFDKSTIRHRIFEYSDSTESKCPSLQLTRPENPKPSKKQKRRPSLHPHPHRLLPLQMNPKSWMCPTS